jgi:putative flippase GtrA
MSRPALEILRYGVNGIVATAVHYAVLTFNLQVLSMSSAGLANVVAALFGISISFIGSRYFVFRQTDKGILPQAAKFGGLYVAFAVVHGIVLFIWTDWLGYDYRLGFLMATAFQIAGSYLGNKFLVFKT